MSTSTPDVVYEAVARYHQAVDVLFKYLVQKEPSFDLLQSDMHYKRFYKGFVVHVMFILCSSVFLYILEENPIGKVFWVVYPILTIHSIYKGQDRLKYRLLDVTQRVKFLAIITYFMPNGSLDKWDQVAQYMNQYFHSEGAWKRPQENFYDGKECLNFYKTEFEPLAAGSKERPFIGLRGVVAETNKVLGLP